MSGLFSPVWGRPTAPTGIERAAALDAGQKRKIAERYGAGETVADLVREYECGEAIWRFLLQQMVAVAELEAGMISKRTKDALAAAKRRGVKLGGDRGTKPSAKVRAKAIAAVETRAAERAADIAPTIKELQAAGATSLRDIAAGLNTRGIPTSRGEGEWSANQVARVLDRL